MTAAVLDVARSWLGTTEDPPGSNHCGITEWYADTSGLEWTRRGNPWCDMSVSKWLSDAGLPTLYAYCPTHVNAFKVGTAGRWIGGGEPLPGDVMFCDWDHDGVADHVGLVEVVNHDGTVTTIEGNTGDAVRRQIRSRAVILGLGRPHYQQPPPEDDMAKYDDDRDEILAAIKLIPDLSAEVARLATVIRGDGTDADSLRAHVQTIETSVGTELDKHVGEARRNIRRVGTAVNAKDIEGTA